VGFEAVHSVEYLPALAARISHSFNHGIAEVRYSRDVNPGNGLFLTSKNETAEAVYSYSGLRRWNFGVNFGLSDLEGLTQELGSYRGYTGGAGLTRYIGKNVHLIARIDGRRFDTTATDFRRLMYRATLGMAFASGDVPLSVW
jgi:hypothetical protein